MQESNVGKYIQNHLSQPPSAIARSALPEAIALNHQKQNPTARDALRGNTVQLRILDSDFKLV